MGIFTWTPLLVISQSRPVPGRGSRAARPIRDTGRGRAVSAARVGRSRPGT